MSAPYTKEWYAELMDKTEARYCEADMDKMRAEIEALKHDLDSYVKAANGYLADVERLQAEIARLKAEPPFAVGRELEGWGPDTKG